MADVYVIKDDESTYYLEFSNNGIAYELNEHFTFYVKNYKFMPKFRAGVWDGKIRLFNVIDNTLPSGLIHELIRWCMSEGYSLKIDPEIHLTRNSDPCPIDVNSMMDSFNLPFKPHDYQIAAVETILKHRKRLVISPTSSGKSLIIYSTVRGIQEIEGDSARILILVPTTSLVEQMVGDFEEYSQKDSSFDANDKCHKIYSGKDKTTKKTIVVSTWQSIFKLNERWFDSFDAVIVDEAHLATSNSITGIMQKCKNASYRIGLTGTIEDTKTHEMALIGLFGRKYNTIETHELMDRNLIAQLKINAIKLIYDDHTRSLCRKFKYNDEIDFVIGNEKRNRFISKLALTRKGNTLILVNRIDDHAKPLKKMMESLNAHMGTQKAIYYVDGTTPAVERENVREVAENSENVVIIASYGTFSTGVSIKNLTNIIFAHPLKSKIKVLQSIGRGLRKTGKGDDNAFLFDIGDDFGDGKQNTLMNHFRVRLNQYKKSKFKYVMKEVRI